MAQGNPLAYVFIFIASIPFLLWWWNRTKKEWSQSGIKEFAIKLSRHKKVGISVIPSPKSGLPLNFWKEVSLWPSIVFSFVLIPMLAINSRFSVQWWGDFITLFIFFNILGIPIYSIDITNYFTIARKVDNATQKLKAKNIYSDSDGMTTLLDVFKNISDDLRMGLDPRILTFDCSYADMSSYSILCQFSELELIKPDKRVEVGVLAKRYYLTRAGATLAKQIAGKGGK